MKWKMSIPHLFILTILFLVLAAEISAGSEDNTHFQLLTTYPLPDSCLDVFVDNINLTAAGNNSGVRVFLQRDILQPELRTSHDSLIGRVVAIDGSNSSFIIGFDLGNESCALATIDQYVIPSEGPEYWGLCKMPYPIEDIKVWYKTYAFVAHGEYGVSIIDIADNLNPRLVTTFDTPGEAHGLDVSVPRILIADGSAGIQFVDITDPANPAIIKSLDTPGEAYSIDIWVSKAYVADGDAGILYIDSIYTNPYIVSSFDTPGKAVDLSLNYLDCFRGRPGVKYRCLPQPIFDRGYIMVADGNAGIHAIRFEDNTPIEITASYDTPGFARRVSKFLFRNYCDNCICVADGEPNIKIISLIEDK
ncbi:MAG: hypothetical protein GY839_00850 [candidate division Zixibacteria bacterium]|nr:hypothetical protein [candidate division Zixibacteria bacterium]